ncbi:hypothetical protein Tco_1516048 [Tanacetum coccineum]
MACKVLLHHYGRFASPPRRSFSGGLVATIDPVELERFSTNQVKRILTYSLGYDENSTTFLYLRKPNCSLDSGLVPLADALQDRNMLLMYAQSHQNKLHVYVSRVEISPLVVAYQHKDEGNKKEKHGKPSYLEDMISYLTKNISRRFTTLYYMLPPNNALSGLKQIKNDYDTNVMYDIASVSGKIQLFVSHHQIDLSTMLIPNDGSLEEAYAGQMAEALQERPLCVPPSNTLTEPHVELKAITTMDGLTLDGSSIPHSNLLVYQEPKTITKAVEIVSSQSTPLNPTVCADHFIYRIDIVDSLYDKFPIENNSLSGNLTPSSDHVFTSLSPSPTPYGDSNFFLEETDTLLSHSNLSLPSYESFCFDIDHQEEKSSGSTTSHSNHSLLEYESLCFDVDHIKEKSSGSTTSHSDLSKYESFHFDPLPPVDRSDSHHEEFADELAHIISSLEHDCFYLYFEPDPGELTRPVEENISKDSTKELQIETFLSFPSRNEDKVFDPEILLIDEVLSFIRKTPHLLSDNFKIDKRDIFSELSLKIKSLICFHPKDKEIRGESS